MSSTDTSNSDSEHKPFDSQEHLSLYKFKIVSEIKDEILGWAQIRLALMTTLLSFLIVSGSYVGIKLLVERHIERIAKDPVEQKIKVLREAGEKATRQVNELELQSKQATSMSIQANHDLLRIRGQAAAVREMVQESESKLKNQEEKLAKIDEGTQLASQFLHEQSLRTKADILQMRNNIELLHSGFQIIEKLAAQIRQTDPSSDLAREFSRFGGEWRKARSAYQKRASDIESRRSIKVIHYVREDAPQKQQQRSQRLLDALQAKGFTAEPWAAESGLTDIEASVVVAKRFGLDDAKVLLRPVVIISPDATINIADLKQVAKAAGIDIPEVKRMPIVPKMSAILAGGPKGSFGVNNLVLIAELAD